MTRRPFKRPHVYGIIAMAALAGCAQLDQQEITPPRSVEAAVGSARSLPDDFLGVNAASVNPLSDQRAWEVFREAGYGHVRYPGGGSANYWDWDLGWIDQELNENDMIWWMMGMQAQKTRFPLDDLARIHDKTGATPVLVLNVVTRDLDDQIGQLLALRDLGVPIERIEFGNELYLEIETMVTDVYPTVADYATEMNRWAAALKAEFPDAKIAVVGAAHPHAPRGRSAGWNRTMLSLLSDDIDAIAEHIYVDSGIGLRVNTDGDAWAAPGIQEKQYEEFLSQDGVERMLGQPFAGWANLNRFSALPEPEDDLEIWITEFNLFDWTGPTRGSWANGLVVGGFLHAFLADSRVALATYHSFGGGPLFTTYLPGRNFWDELAVADVRITPYHRTATGVVLELFSRAIGDSTSASVLEFDPNVSVRISSSRTYPALWGWQFGTGEDSALLIANYAADPVSLSLAGVDVGGRRYEQYHAAPQEYVTNPRSLGVTRGRVDGEVYLSPYSVTVILRPDESPD